MAVATRSIFDPLVPAGAYDEFAATAAPAGTSGSKIERVATATHHLRN